MNRVCKFLYKIRNVRQFKRYAARKSLRAAIQRGVSSATRSRNPGKNRQTCHQAIGVLAFNIFAKKRADEKKGADIENRLAHVIAMAELALKDRNIEKAEQILHSALRLAEDNKINVGVSCVYDMLATIAFQKGEITQAENYLVRIIERLIQLGYPEENNTIINFKLKLSRIYANIHNDELAEMGFKNCLRIQNRKTTGPSDEETEHLLVSILFWYGKFLMDRGRPEQARRKLEQAYSHSERVTGIKPAQEMVLLYYLADLCFAMKDFEAAERHLVNALVIGKTADNPDTPHYLVKLGAVYLFRGMYDKARVWCQRGENLGKRKQNRTAISDARDCLKQLDELQAKIPH